MKLENEPGFAVQTPPRKSYNPFDSDDENTNGFVESNINTYDVKSFEENADSLTFHLDNGDISWEEAILSPAIPADANGEEGDLFRKKATELFTDKTVVECELPELMVCYKENSYNSVKDICIDEGLPAHEELKCTEDSVKGSELDSGDLERQHSSNHCGTDDSFKVEEFRHDLSKKETDSGLQNTGDETRSSGVMVNAMRDHQLSEKDELNYIKVDKNANEVSREGHGIDDDVSLEHVEESSTKPSTMNSKEAIVESRESKRDEATSPQSVELPVSQESGGSVVANALSYNSKVESGSIVLDFNSSSTILLKEEKEKKSQQNMEAGKPLDFQTTPTEKPPRTQTMSRHDNEALGTDKWVHDETSFAAEMPPPASIIYMGPNARSGSISLRSESSTGSTRSFAFPVLQAEWNSSPVRMAKAEQRHLRKHRGWVHSLMCCRF